MASFASRMKASTSGSGKFLIPIGVIAVAAIGYTYFSADPPAVNPSSVSKGAMETATLQGGTTLTPRYSEELAKADQQRIAAAKDSGTSAIPTIRPGTAEQLNPIPLLDPVVEDTPVIETPNVDPAPIVLNAPITPAIPIVTAPPPMLAQQNPENLQNLQTYMAGLRRANPVAEVTAYANMADFKVEAPSQTAPAGQIAAAGTAEDESKIKLPLAGKILYAQLVSRANSDAPGPVLAKIVQGQYAGATLIGSFQKAQDSLIISFDRMTVETTRDGEEINETVAIKSVAVSTDYIGTALATSVDRHMFQKIAIGFTAAFAQGFGDAVSDRGNTTIDTGNGTITTSNGDLNSKEELMSATGKAVAQTGSILMDEFGRRPTTIIVESGTPIGVLFL